MDWKDVDENKTNIIVKRSKRTTQIKNTENTQKRTVTKVNIINKNLIKTNTTVFKFRNFPLSF